MVASRAIFFLLTFLSLSLLVQCFNFDRDVLSHFRSKRQLKRVCAAELYSAPLNTICKIPPFIAHTAGVGKCLGKLKMKSLMEGDPVCAFDCTYQDAKWATAAGALDFKKLSADFIKGVGAPWAAVATAACKKCTAEATKRLTAKFSSGYVSKCKGGAYMFQTCVVSEMYINCPASLKSAAYNTGKTALMACDPFALTKTPAELAAAATNGLKGIDAKGLGALAAGQDPKALLAKLPPGMAGMIPKGMDVSKLDTKALMANPAALAGKLPPGVNLAALMGR